MNNFHMREGKVEFRWKRWRNKKRQEVSSCLMVLFSGAVLLGAGGVALAGPTGGQVTGGQGTITNPNGTTTNINQQSNVLNINWQDFSIGAGETVNFYQPGSTSVAINRVVGGVPSYLAGALNANGRVFILNSAGITFTGTSQVNVGALLATTAMTVNGDPTQAASYSGSGYGAVINQGSISVSNGGFAILAAPYVQNTGFIKADLGTIALAGTNQFTLDLSGTGLINFVVPAGAVEKIVSDGKAVGVDNAGTLQARSGQVLISANVASEVVNAVVNLNGIVDADAFAANGQGGSVLVTAAGDVNVGGQVTARGNGTGNGGQIVTKAGSNDVIGQLAFVSATGGASGGKGGFVEISGKQVGLQGAIDPGSGGSLYIDPNNIHVVAANSGPLVGSSIGTDFIEDQLRHSVNVNLAADHNVFFDAFADDHQLVGGNGNLTITAGLTAPGNITFGHSANGANPGTNDAIVQGGGFIHMNANGGNIGSSAHAITLVTGVNNTTAGVGVTQAGDIVLVAGNDITVKKVQIKSSGGSVFTAKFSANAGHNFTAIGDINVTANAHGSGHEQATASVNILAHNNINAHNIAVVALASASGNAIGHSASASANLLMNAQTGTVAARNLLIDASAFGAGNRRVRASALGSILANNDININGSINVAAAAVGDNTDGSNGQAIANLLLSAVTGHVNVTKDVIVDALAKNLNSSAQATASANINANTDVTIHGNVAVKATASGSNTQATSDQAFANLLVHAGGDMAINRDVTVAALAHGFGVNLSHDANATAQASANLTANDIDIAGNVAVRANAVQTGDRDFSSVANAFANLLMHANTGHVDVTGNVSVNAFARQGGSSTATANALANVLANTDIALGGIKVTASADNVGSAVSGALAAANLVMQAVKGNITVDHDIVVGAVADSGGTGSVQANAVANVVANVGITVGGNADVAATANQHGGSGSDASANANLTMDAVTGNISVGGIAGAHAIAQASGSSTAAADAKASANIHAQNNVDLGGASVTANAKETASSQADGAIADANLQIQAIAGHVNVSGDIEVAAFAQQSASDQGSAFAQANVNAHTFINVNGNVEVTASANNVGSDASTAAACASLQMVTGTGHIAVNHDIIVHAFAKESGSNSAVATANALANIQANTDITVGGNVDVTATANADNSDASNANALANLAMNAVGGTLHINHGVMVNAIAHDGGGGTGSPRAHASANLFGNVDVIVGNNVAVLASVDHDSDTQGARAFANLQVLANTRNVSLGGVDVKAIAHSGGSSSAHANASANVVAHSNLAIGGNVIVSASADQTGSNGTTAYANANLQLNAVTGSINIAGNLDVVANARSAGNDGTNSAAANALANIVAQTNVHIGGVASVSAIAAQTGAAGTTSSAGARAIANLQVNAVTGSAGLGGINVRAVAHETANSSARATAFANVLGHTNVRITNDVDVFASAHQGDALGSSGRASANLQLNAVTGSVNIGHNVLVQANAFDNGASFAQANASASILGHTNVVIGGNVDVIGTAQDLGSGGNQGALAIANLQVHAASGSINIGGDVGAYANAVEDAHAFAQANATVNMLANNGITVGGSVEATATAHQESALGSWARACANIILDAAHRDINVKKDVHASANAVNVGSESAIADALINANAVAGDVLINGVVTANAHAVASSHHSFNGALALSSINVHGDPVVLGGLAGHASAYSHGTDFANALMNVHVNGAAVTIHGVSALFANAIDANVHGDGAQAVANVVVHASGGGSGDLRIDNAFSVTASANDHASNDHANALATVNLTGMADNSSAIVVNDVNVRANALDANGNGLTLADAELLIAASSAGGGVRLLHNVHVNATADEVLGTPAAHAHAIGNAFINAGRVVDGSGNDIFVFANAVDGSSANALATLHITANHIDVGDSGKIGAQAVAKAIHNNDQAHALANVDIAADTGNASVHGNLEGIASASFTTPGATVLNNITASALVHVAANQNVHLEDINVTADAENWGNNTAHAVASLNVQANHSINLDGHILVNALAHDHNSHGNGSPYAAVALANVFFNGTVVTTVDNTSNSVDVRAHAIDDGHNAAKASADFVLGTGVTNVLLGGITLDVLAHDTDTLAGGVGAVANAILIQTNAAAEFNVGTHGINLQADASSQGTAQAQANAHLQIHQNTLVVQGGITLNAQAVGGALTHNAILATASLDLMANGIFVGGLTDVKANAHNLGVNSHAVALANAEIVGTGPNQAVNLNDITVEAYAFDSHAKGKETLANAQLLIEGLGVNGEILTRNVTVIGSADQAGGSGSGAKAVGLANVDLEATLGVGVGGGVAALAFAHDPHGTNATASANVHANANEVVITGTGHHVFHIPGSAGTLATATASYGILAVAAAVYSGSDVAAGHGAHALANVAVNAQNEVEILHGVEMLAFALDEGGATANANAHLAIHANTGSVGIGFGHLEVRVPGSHGSTLASLGLFAGVFVGAVAVDTGAQGHAHANALTQINAANSVVIQAGVMQLAAAVDTSGNSARATANLEIAASRNVFINQGEIDLFLSDQLASSLSHNLGSSLLSNLIPGGGLAGHHSTGFAVVDGAVAFDGGGGTSHHANALASVNIDPAVVEIDGPVLVAAVAIDNSGAGASANAVLNIHGNQVGIGSESGHGDVAVLAVAVESGNLDGNAKATANATITASHSGSAISLNGVTVAAAAFDHDATGSLDDLANAQLLISASHNGDIRTGSLNVFALASAEGTVVGDANALANATVMTNNGDITIDGDVSVVANAQASTGAGDANAVALLTLKANHFLDVEGHIGVAADATARGESPASAQATATANIVGGRVTVDSGIDVTAAADETNSDGGDARAIANLAMSASTGTLAVNGHLRVSADATTDGSNGTAVANASANLHANNGDISLTGNVDVDATAIASESTGGGASACANLKIIASSGTVEIHGNVNVNAFADHSGTGSARADADALIWANTKPGGHGGDVKIFGNIGMKATAEGSNSGTSTAANVSLNIVASSGNVFVGGGVFLRADAQGSGSATTLANLAATINARHSVVIGGDIFATASAGQFSGDTNVGANAIVAVVAGNDISMHGARVRAGAVQFSSDNGDTAQALAELALVAGSNISVGTHGLLVQAGAVADSAGPASANALLSLDAGTQGVGGIFVHGNVIATAKAIGSATGNLAHANVHMAAGGANEFSTGAPSNFGNIVVIGQIGAFAYADATNDKATASVEIFAHNNILIVGNDPIASAKVGPSGGTLFAFRQAHFSTQFSDTGADGQHVLADIDIRAGGSITVVPASSLEHVLKLYAMPTDAPTLNSSGGLTIIPLSIDGQDCGVLGLAGTDPNTVAKGQACHRKPINVSDLTDTGP